MADGVGDGLVVWVFGVVVVVWLGEEYLVKVDEEFPESVGGAAVGVGMFGFGEF